VPRDYDHDALSSVWDAIPGIGYLDDSGQEDYLHDLFERGWVDQDSNISKEERDAIRDEFYDAYGIDEANFPWEEWREAMGYE
jgi:hypothetical protein